MGDQMSDAPPQTEFQKLSARAVAVRNQLNARKVEVGGQYHSLLRARKWWQTFVVLGAALSTGLAGYIANSSGPVEGPVEIDLRLLLAVIVALAGAIAAVRDAWQVSENVDDARQRYVEIKELLSELEVSIYEAEGFNRDEDRLKTLGPMVRRAEARLIDLSDNFILGRGRVTRAGDLTNITTPPAYPSASP
jgi:hypothetical protein